MWNKTISIDFGILKQKINWIDVKDKTQIRKIFDENFEDIYRESIWEWIVDWAEDIADNVENRPYETIIDISSVVYGWLNATILTTETWWLWIVQAWVVYSVSHDALKSSMYGLLYYAKWINSADWVEVWLWFKRDSMDSADFLINKWFEYSSNMVLFSIFAWVFKANKKLWLDKFKDWLRDSIKQWLSFENVWTKIWYEWWKIWIEATMFNEFHAVSWWIQKWINDFRHPENVSLFDEKWFIDYYSIQHESRNYATSFMYNYMFIIWVKGGIYFPNKFLRWWNMKDWEIVQNIETGNQKLQAELDKLTQRWRGIYKPEISKDWFQIKFIDDYGRLVEFDSPRLQGLRDILIELDRNWDFLVNRNLDYNPRNIERNIDNRNVDKRNIEKRTTDEYRGKLVPQRENWRWGQEGTVLGIVPERLSLQEVLTWFKKDSTELTWRFRVFMDTKFNSQEFANIWEINKIRGQVREEIREEVMSHYNRDSLTKREEEVIDRLADEFIEATKQRIEVERGELKEMNEKYGDPKVMREIMGRFTERLSEEVKYGFIGQYEKFINNQLKRWSYIFKTKNN